MRSLIERVELAFPRPSSRIVRLTHERPIVFVGDVHGDLDAVRRVFARFPSRENTLVFLGDLVDRGPDSLAVLEEVMEAKVHDASSVHVLMGNHEAWTVMPFRQADFWRSLPKDLALRLGTALLALPYMAWHPCGLAAVHGALPDLTGWDEVDGVLPGSEPWRAMAWGDWVAEDGDEADVGGRPALGPRAFADRTRRFGMTVLIRSHQKVAPLYLFQDRCLTLFTSCAYGAVRQVARWKPCQEVNTARDLELIEI